MSIFNKNADANMVLSRASSIELERYNKLKKIEQDEVKRLINEEEANLELGLDIVYAQRPKKKKARSTNSKYKLSGIYCITNTITHYSYIGQSVNIHSRKSAHFSTLRSGIHKNKLLQEHYDTYGQHSFEFTILHKASKEHLDELEVYYHTKYRNNNNKLYSDVYKHYHIPCALWSDVDKLLDNYKSNI